MTPTHPHTHTRSRTRICRVGLGILALAGGGMFVNSFVLNHVCQLRQRMAKLQISINNSYPGFASFGGHTKLTNIPFQDLCLFNLFPFFFSHISFGLSGPLRTAYNLKTPKKSAGCDCANGKCY